MLFRSALKRLDVRRLSLATYDARGFRHVAPGLDADCDTHVLFLGDSFTDGLWVEDDETFASRFGALSRGQGGAKVCPVNAGVDGYGPPEETYILETYFAAAGNPRLVFLQLFPNDIVEDYGPVFDGTLPGLDARWTRLFSFLARAADFCRTHGAELVLVVMPDKTQFDSPGTRTHYQDRVRAFADDAHIRQTDLYEAFRARAGDVYWSWDPHLTPEGHAVVADALYRATADRLRPIAR